MADDNIDVLLLGSVAVAVKNVSLLDGTDVAKLIFATPLAFVVEVMEPMSDRPCPAGVALVLAKICTVYVVLGVAVSVPLIWTASPEVWSASVSTGAG